MKDCNPLASGVVSTLEKDHRIYVQHELKGRSQAPRPCARAHQGEGLKQYICALRENKEKQPSLLPLRKDGYKWRSTFPCGYICTVFLDHLGIPHLQVVHRRFAPPPIVPIYDRPAK
jgi:hypothetical protein